MILKVSKKNIYSFFSILLFTLYAFTIGLHQYIYFKHYWGVILSFSLSFLFMFLCNDFILQRVDLVSFLVILMSIIVITFNNWDFKSGEISSSLIIIVGFLFFMISKNNNKWHSSGMGIICFWGIMHSIFTIIALISPFVFKNIMMPLFTDNIYTRSMLTLYDQGCITGLAPHYSTNAMYLSVALGVPFSYYVVKKDNKFFGILLLMFIALLLTGKRGPTIFVLLSMFLSYIFLNKNKGIKPVVKVIFMVLLGGISLILVADYIPELLNVFNRFIETYNKGDIGGGRYLLRLLAIHYFRKDFLFGIGWDGFRFLNNGIPGLKNASVHCVYLQLICEVGIVGCIPFFLFMFCSYYYIVGTLLRVISHSRNSVRSIALVYSIYMQTFFLLYCFTGNPLYDAPTLFMYIIACSISYYYRIIDY